MRQLRISLCVLCSLVCMAGGAFALEIQVAPQMLVLSSNSGKLTVHTDVPYATAETVVLVINETTVAANTFADDRGNLVAQCSKAAVKEVIGDFPGENTTATVTLTVNGNSDSELIRVKK